MNKKMVSGLILSLFLVACKSTPIADPTPVSNNTTPSTDASSVDKAAVDTSNIAPVAIDSNANDSTNSLNDPNNILSKRNVYFDLDSDIVKDEYRPLVEAHAKYLLAHTSAKTIIQGNTDERGTREYNLSLGQRRAVAVKKIMNLLGVQDAQIETVSYGKEKANESCTDDGCYQKDRHADIVYGNE